jgi:hypothetical protein
MQLSDTARIMIGLTLIIVPTIQYGGYFLLTQLVRPTVIKSDLQASYFRAGHAHAGVLVLLGLIAQMLIDSATLIEPLAWLARIGFVIAPMLISGGFFGAAPRGEGREPTRLINLIYIGAGLLAVCLVVLGVGLLFV